MTRYKAVRPDGTDFRTGTVDYLAGGIITAPITSQSLFAVADASSYLSVSTSPTNCTGMSWPCRLLIVEPLYEWIPSPYKLRNKRACRSLRVVGERPAHEALGPQGADIAALIERAGRLAPDEAKALSAASGAGWGAAWNAAWDAAWDAARGAAWDAVRGAVRGAARDAVRDAARGAVRGAARDAVRDAARALVVRDLITDEQYRILAGPWLDVIGDVS